MFDLISVGYLTIDRIYLPDRDLPVVALGGSVAYVSLAARLLNVKASVISKVGTDFSDPYLRQLNRYDVDLSGLMRAENARTTFFRLKYNSDLSYRELQLGSKCSAITLQDLPKHLKAKVVHLAPVAGEVTYEVAKKLRESVQELSLDPQGLLRIFDEDGKVTLSSLADGRILELVDIYKSSSDEIEALTGETDLKKAIKIVHDGGVETVIVTLGNEGAMLSSHETMYRIPVCNSRRLVDPTGAGDVFIGAFLAEYLRGESILWCGYVGSAAASLIVESVGPNFSGGRGEIYQRAYGLYKKGIK